jgi:hypothetical protein
MTAEQRFDRELPEILADLYPVSAPDYRNDLVQQIAATRQRPAWALPERWIPMTAIALGRSVRPVPWRTIGLVALLLLSIVAAAIIAGSQRRLPPPFGPAANGNLVVAEDGDIFLIDSATGAKTLASGGPETDIEPVFSRDGTRIAFFREADGVRTDLTWDGPVLGWALPKDPEGRRTLFVLVGPPPDDKPEAISRCVCDSVVRAPIADHAMSSCRY